jgi:hypothetical protein
MTENRRSDDSRGRVAKIKAFSRASQKIFTKLSYN